MRSVVWASGGWRFVAGEGVEGGWFAMFRRRWVAGGLNGIARWFRCGGSVYRWWCLGGVGWGCVRRSGHDGVGRLGFGLNGGIGPSGWRIAKCGGGGR